ncbi:MAG: hypothetical protein ABEJ57_05980 [Halobacteriaceae archaeon]
MCFLLAFVEPVPVMRYWESSEDGTLHIVPGPYAPTLCGRDTGDGQLVGQVRPSRRGVDVATLCESCRVALRDRTDGSTAPS